MDVGRREHQHPAPKNGIFLLGHLRGGSSGGVVPAGSNAKDGAGHGGSGTTHRRRELPAASDFSFASLPKGGGAFPFDPTSPVAAGAGGLVVLAGILATAVSFTFLYSRRSRRRHRRRLAANHDALLPLMLRDASGAEGCAHPELLVEASGAMAAKWQCELVTVQPGCAFVECHRSRGLENKVTTEDVELRSPPTDDAQSQPLAAASASVSDAAKDSALGANVHESEDSLIDTQEEGEDLVFGTTATKAAKGLSVMETDEPHSSEIEALVVCRVSSSSKREEVIGGVVGSLSSTAEDESTANNGAGRCSSQRECVAESISDEAQTEHRTESSSFHGLKGDVSLDGAAAVENSKSDSITVLFATPDEAIGPHHGDGVLVSGCDRDSLDQHDAVKASTSILDEPAHNLELDMQTIGETNINIVVGVAKCCHGNDQMDATLDTNNENAKSLPAIEDTSPLKGKRMCPEEECHPHQVSRCVTGYASAEERVRVVPQDGDHAELEQMQDMVDCDEDRLLCCDSSDVYKQEKLCNHHNTSLQRECLLVQDEVQVALLLSTSSSTSVSRVVSSQLSTEVAPLSPCLTPKSEEKDYLPENIQATQQTRASSHGNKLVPSDAQGDTACKQNQTTEKGRIGTATVSPMPDTGDETNMVPSDSAEQPWTRQRMNVGERPVTKPEPAGLGQSMSSWPVDGAGIDSHSHPRKEIALACLVVFVIIVAIVVMLSFSGQVPVLRELFGVSQSYCKTDDFYNFSFLKNVLEGIRFTDEM